MGEDAADERDQRVEQIRRGGLLEDHTPCPLMVNHSASKLHMIWCYEVTCMCSNAEAMKYDAVNALLDLSSINDVRLSMSKTFWAGFDFYDDL